MYIIKKHFTQRLHTRIIKLWRWHIWIISIVKDTNAISKKVSIFIVVIINLPKLQISSKNAYEECAPNQVNIAEHRQKKHHNILLLFLWHQNLLGEGWGPGAYLVLNSSKFSLFCKGLDSDNKNQFCSNSPLQSSETEES